MFKRVVAWLPAVISALNNEETQLAGKKPSEAIKAKQWHKSPPPLFQAVLWAFTSKSFLQGLAFTTCAFRVSWRVAAVGLLTLSGP